MTKLQKIKYSLLTILSFFVSPIVRGQSAIENASIDAQNMAGLIGYKNTSSQNILFLIGTIIKYTLSFIGVIFLALVIINGFKWMTAGGNEETVKKARSAILDLVKGLLVIALAYIITSLIPFIMLAID